MVCRLAEIAVSVIILHILTKILYVKLVGILIKIFKLILLSRKLLCYFLLVYLGAELLQLFIRRKEALFSYYVIEDKLL